MSVPTNIFEPDLIRYVQEQVKQGRYESIEAMIEAGLQLLMREDEAQALDPATLAAVRKSREQLDRGEGRDFRQALLELRRKYEQQST
jgi:Arc/MetJ-type ribon-helix-helix transcriptional regulator